MDTHLSPAETAKRFGISIKALRLYEQRGLLTPLRTTNGSTGSAWRVYGPDQIARLHQILTLKRLGLSLARIGEVLGGADRLEAVLELQERTLAKDGERVSRALALVKAARAKLASGQVLSIGDLATLNQDTAMTRLSPKEMNQIMMPFADRHLSAMEKEAMRAKIIDRDQLIKNIDDLISQSHEMMKTGDPTSPAALDLARRWVATTGQFSEGDPVRRAKIQAIWQDALDDPAAASKLALNREIFAFVDRAIAHLKAQDK